MSSAAPTPPAEGDCFLCRGLAVNSDRANLIARRTPLSAVVLNRYPYNNGHLLVAPLAHKADLAGLSDAEAARSAKDASAYDGHVDKPDEAGRLQYRLELGRVAGAGLPGHLHWHIVPRWNGDTNFMPVLGETKVISQSLDALYELLVEKETV